MNEQNILHVRDVFNISNNLTQGQIFDNRAVCHLQNLDVVKQRSCVFKEVPYSQYVTICNYENTDFFIIFLRM